MKDENYIVIQGWMISKLKLTGNELVLFALIYGFSQDGKSQYKGSLSYISQAMQVSKRTVIRLKNSLISRQFIIKFSDGNGDRFSYNSKVVNSVLNSKETLLLGSDKTLLLGSDKTLPNIYNNIYITTTIEKIENNLGLLEILAMQNKLKLDTIKSKINEFVLHCKSIYKIHNNDSDLFSHFGNWIRSLNLKDVNVNDEFIIFIDLFNQVSKKEFVATSAVKQLFVVAMSNGFTGKQMVTAMRNLYSTSDKNKWHKNNHYEFATPEFLLKNENLNKYLNADY